MKNQEQFNRTISTCVKAYQNDTLRHWNCAACAVGNLIAASIGSFTPMWQYVFISGTFNLNAYTGEAKRQIDSTGYTVQELAKIEHAFETASFGQSTEDWIFNGLMAVVDVLMEIHEASQEEVQEAKLLFSKC